jgi:hypothetical protein
MKIGVRRSHTERRRCFAGYFLHKTSIKPVEILVENIKIPINYDSHPSVDLHVYVMVQEG